LVSGKGGIKGRGVTTSSGAEPGRGPRAGPRIRQAEAGFSIETCCGPPRGPSPVSRPCRRLRFPPPTLGLRPPQQKRAFFHPKRRRKRKAPAPQADRPPACLPQAHQERTKAPPQHHLRRNLPRRGTGCSLSARPRPDPQGGVPHDLEAAPTPPVPGEKKNPTRRFCAHRFPLREAAICCRLRKKKKNEKEFARKKKSLAGGETGPPAGCSR